MKKLRLVLHSMCLFVWVLIFIMFLLGTEVPKITIGVALFIIIYHYAEKIVEMKVEP
jgi:hypothetical protein